MDRVKALVLERKLALRKKDEELAAAIGVSRQTLSKMMKKSTSEWRLKHIIAACKFLGIKVDELREAIVFK